MKEQMKILVGYDGSSSAEAALDDLGRAGLARNAEAVILTVSERWLPAWPPQEVVESSEASSSTREVTKSKSRHVAATAVAPASEASALALQAKARLQTRFPDWVLKVEEAAGSPSHEILKKADELKPNLIVVGCQGRSALGAFLLGSVSQKVVNEASCPVRVSRGTAWKNGSPVRILIGLDGTAGSELAVAAVASRVWPTSSAVRLVTALDPAGTGISGNELGGRKKNSSETRSMNREVVEKFMKDAARKLRATQLSVSTRIEEGDPKRVLTADAEEWGADSIFLGASSRHNFVERYLLGSVATAVVARAHCSVEVVRSGY